MAKEKQALITEDLSVFLAVDVSPGKDIRGFECDSPGVLLRTATTATDEAGNVTGEVKYEFKRGAKIYPVCVDDKITSGNLVGGE